MNQAGKPDLPSLLTFVLEIKLFDMKTLITLLIMATTTTAAMAQTEKKFKEIKFSETSEIINVSADVLWEIIGPGFADAAVWATNVDHAVSSGEPQFEGATCSERACDLNAKGFNKIREVISIYDPKKRILAFDITEGLPGFVVYSNSHWQITPIGPNQAKITVTVTIHAKKFMGTLMGGMLKSNIKRAIPVLINDLTIYAQTGKISKEKRERMEKIGKKPVATL
ncbi:MAG: hypothetical protein CL840_05400 [Crocinitomicaceae bacterium]|nr:hypothetical protein [Crocinitomicaceae bacterium]